MQKHIVRFFATRAVTYDLPRATPATRRKLGKTRLSKTHGFLGHGEPLRINYKRRWRGGRYNYFHWNTLLQCINKCPSIIERDRMPSPQELNYFYRGAQIGVRHHGGFDIVAQILNLRPYKPYLIKEEEYPNWIEEEWIEKKMNENSDTKSIHRHSIPDSLKMENKVKTIRGKTLTRNDKRRIIREIYKKINIKFYENDVEKREAIKYEYQMYKQQLRENIIEKEKELDFYPIQIESEKGRFDKQLYSANGKHLLFSDVSHIDTEEKEMKKQKKSSKISGKLSKLFKRNKKTE
eukprot:76012_1